jgi:hypothetical protein
MTIIFYRDTLASALSAAAAQITGGMARHRKRRHRASNRVWRFFSRSRAAVLETKAYRGVANSGVGKPSVWYNVFQ